MKNGVLNKIIVVCLSSEENNRYLFVFITWNSLL